MWRLVLLGVPVEGVNAEAKLDRHSSLLVFQSDAMFKEACLWNWCSSHTNNVHLGLFTETLGSLDKFSSLSNAVDGFEVFLVQTFGIAWENCTYPFRKSFVESAFVIVCSPMFLKYKFEQACMAFGIRLRQKELAPGSDTGAFWAAAFSAALLALDLSEHNE